MSSDATMDWLPRATDFREALRAATAEPADGRLEKLAALTHQRLDFLQTIQLDQAIRKGAFERSKEFTTVRLALLSSCTVNHLVAGITVGGLRRKLLIDTYVAPYGQYRQSLLEGDAALAAHKPNFVLLSLNALQVMPQVQSAATAAEASAAVNTTVEELKWLWAAARERYGATVIQQTFLKVAAPLFGSYDRVAAGAPGNQIERLNNALADAAGREGVLLLDVAREAERAGLDAWFDIGRWLHGKMEISPSAAPLYGELVARVIGAQRGLSKKCLVLDLDNTMWGGVVGDVGVEGLTLGEGSGVGEAHLALQRYAKQLRDRGIVLAVCSKNDPATAQAAFRDHPEMVLKLSDIAVFIANWEDKASNLLTIAERLNLGIDSLVFVDDNPAERARIRQALPMVAVPELPDDAAQYVRCLAGAGYFEAVALTADDAERAKQYEMNASREALRLAAPTIDEFLKSLEMKTAYGSFRSIDLQRVTQLVNKTNQFNPTTKRYSLQEITELTAADACLTLRFRLIDRFGDNGLVSVMILRPVANEPGVLEIDTWVMSCRVFGRQLELEAMNVAVEAARARGIRAFKAAYMPTAKNGVVKDLYANLQFARTGESTTTDGSTQWRLDLDQYVSQATFIARQTIDTAEIDDV